MMGQFRAWRRAVVGNPVIVESYANRDRLIPNALYNNIKGRKKCKVCGLRSKRRCVFEIHHVVPIFAGGKNVENNLVLVCKVCHRVLDAEQKIKFSEEYKNFKKKGGA